MLNEFKEFAAKGNVVDLAVGVVIGGAFGKIVTSLVNDIIMPIVAVPTGKVNFTELVWTIGETKVAYGNFIQAIVDFLIIAFSIFMIVKGLNKLHRKEEAAPTPAPAQPSEEVKLLTEIRDCLKK
ncbi:MAG: large-conductance mechanosensitive channel protein MscL [Eubacteriales bacterium]|nr:large-conductance mechanosensitive channel protein MscL [Eubacteriales bacterium]